ncbi:hypothetical protein TNCV_247571 [Trichonephila clavipes]|nr:hypothetical protein TNCV_247571 [Trichonephila clavipes]
MSSTTRIKNVVELQWQNKNRANISHTCSIGFKSGEYAGQSIRVISSNLRHSSTMCCMVRTGVVIRKQKFSTHGAPKQTYMLFQNDIPIDVACQSLHSKHAGQFWNQRIIPPQTSHSAPP